MKVLKWLDENIESFILIVLSILTVVVVFIQVFMRYVLGSSLVWSEELARYAFIWMIYIGVSYGVKRQAHIKVDAFALIFKRTGKLVLALCANVAFLLFAILLTYYSFEVVSQVTRTSPAMSIPMQWVYAAPMVGLFLTSIRIIQQMIKQITAFKSGE
ncbi:TRAP transporter small permease protein [Alkalihalophilus pseudofirmus]|uniref:TRAP transporter small permease n=1 Tax=Alkalihalobacterium alkalinitrilicum TaxID=427920 RepID=UPI00094D80B8|nr:TRAP transporter small permease [Alkalihalobacterium alkalinitrilicum]OLO27877.1 TRAP transporter small permease protein [Alkalihalophilus pseudofirmus]